MSTTDRELLADYVAHHGEDAFTEIVRRHLPLVYTAALRQVRSPQLAEEVAQSAFLKLASHATRLAPHTILSAWLYQVTRREAIDVVRREARRQLREHIATEMNTTHVAPAVWTQVEPLLDEAMDSLDEADRAAVLLRYFENRPLREVGQRLGTSEDAAQKRVRRAVERLREFFAAHGVTIGAGALAATLPGYAVQAAPAGLVATIAGVVKSAVAAGPVAVVPAGPRGASGILDGLRHACRSKFAVGIAVTALVGTAVFLAIRSHNPAPDGVLGNTASDVKSGAADNGAANAPTPSGNTSQAPGQPDPRALLRGIAEARQRLVSGSLELQVFTERFENGRQEAEPPTTLKVLFDGSKLRFDSVQRQYRYPFFDDYDSAEAKEAFRRADSLPKEDAVRAGLLGSFEAHEVAAWDGEMLVRFSESDGSGGTTNVEDPASGSPSYFFDPRCLGLSESLRRETTIAGCLGLDGPKSVQLLGEELVEAVPAWRVQVQSQYDTTLDFWIEMARPWRLLKQATSISSAQSKYDEANPRDPIPVEVTTTYSYPNRALSFSKRFVRLQAEFGQPVDPMSFTFAGLGMPVGTVVNDLRIHGTLGYWTGAGLADQPLRPESPPKSGPPVAELLAQMENAPGLPEALDAATRLLLNTPDGPAVELAAEVVRRWHSDNTNLVHLCQELERVRHRCATNLLEAILEQNPSAEVRAQACYSLGMLHKDAANYGTNPAATVQAEKLFQSVLSESDAKGLGGINLASNARRELDEIQRLFIGKPAPEIAGNDFDGRPVRLSDYRGRVVVVTFWSAHYLEAIEHRKLVERMAGKPFAFLGVFDDDDLAKGKAVVERYGITWPSVWDKRSGPVSTEWLVRSWTSVWVLDRQGRIRYRGLRWGQELDDAVTRLLEEQGGPGR
ncbi:MAG: sigma-70 family RNA polymerase sigma factor [Verrucomicrobiales bacterium]|nr:sigma-70 family RNA polymerase sigma factor [Verrucomicrobiales bacterium]